MHIPLLLIGGIGVTELILILLILLFVFGASKLPKIGAGVGQAIKNLRSSLKGEEKENKPDEDQGGGGSGSP